MRGRFVGEKEENNNVRLIYCTNVGMPADVLEKAISKESIGIV